MRAVSRSVRVIGALAVALVACVDSAPSAPAPSSRAPGAGVAATPPIDAVCTGPEQRCFAWKQRDVAVSTLDIAATPSGFGPADLISAYNVPTVTATATIALVDAYGYPNLESDLATYRSQFGLPACTTASGCLKIVNQSGATSPLPSPPPAQNDWTQETALDVQMASAMCPTCTLLVVQADSDTGTNLYVANNTAASLGATVISNSWGAPEGTLGPPTSLEQYFAHNGIAIFAAAGDAGFNDGGRGANYPATSNHVIAVGGTALQRDTSKPRGWVESAWSQGGSGCSTSISKPSWQTSTACADRMSSDIAALGDPATGVAVYNAAGGGWGIVGGTSAASPIVAALFAAFGHGNATAHDLYTNINDYFDVVSGTNGSCGSILCTAGVGWDGPTGVGTPNGSVLSGAKVPTLTVNQPLDGQAVPAGFTIDVTCTSADSATITSVVISIDSEPLGMYTTPPYKLTAPTSFANGKHAIVVVCTTSSLAQATANLSVTQTAACASDGTCATAGDICYAGACIAGPGQPNGLGSTCTQNSDCASDACASDGMTSQCVVSCTPGGTACPSGFTCIASGASSGVCWTGGTGGGGGCCSAHGGVDGMLLALALVPLWGRRRRRPRAA